MIGIKKKMERENILTHIEIKEINKMTINIRTT